MLKIFSVLPLFFPGNGIQRGINFDPTNSDSFVSFSILITKNVLGTFEYNFRQKMSQTILPGLGKSNVGSHKNRDLGTFLKIGPLLPLFRLFLSFSNKHCNFYNNKCAKMYIEYPVLGFEPTTFGKWVSSHNHLTTAPSQPGSIFVKDVKISLKKAKLAKLSVGNFLKRSSQT